MMEGEIKSIIREIVEVEFSELDLKIGDVLRLKEEKDVKLEVKAIKGRGRFLCFLLSKTKNLKRGDKVEYEKSGISLPVGKELLGRVIDPFGNPLDNLGKLKTQELKTIKYFSPPYQETIFEKEIIETGIKAIDFFAPLLKGGKLGIIGGAGLGKTVLLLELMHNLVQKKEKEVLIFAGIGERIREGAELYETLKKMKILDSAVLIFGQMDKPAVIRFQAGISAISIAEYFRDVEKKNVLFFVDNVYRFLQAGNELSTLLEKLPSEGGYQPTLFSEIGQFEEKLVSTKDGFVTSVQAIYVPADDISDPAIQATFPYFDSIIIFSRDVYQQGRKPAIDLLNSFSSAISEEILGREHYFALLEAKKVLERYRELDRIVKIVGEAELSLGERNLYNRAKKILNFMTQDFFVVKDQTQREGKFVKRKETIDGVKSILEGRFDNLDPKVFLNIGSVKDIK
jgi:F-type H+-transporting ATPase subunit beta